MPRPLRRIGAGIALGIAWLVVGGPATAGESAWYLGAAYGQAELEAVFGSQHSKRLDDDDSSASLTVGYSAHRHLAVEAGYHDLGTHRGTGSPCAENDGPCIERLAGLGLCIEGTPCTEVQVGLEADVTGYSLAAIPLFLATFLAWIWWAYTPKHKKMMDEAAMLPFTDGDET